MTKTPDDFEQLLRQGKKGVDADNALVERRLAQMYRDAYKAVDEQIKDLYARLGDKMSLPEAQKYKRLEAVQKSIADEYRRMTGNALRLSIDTSAQNYSEAWYRFAWAGDQALALELGWGVLPVDAIRASVYSENSGLTIIKTFRKNAKQNLSQIQSALTRGIATGQGYAKTAASIKKSFGNGYSDAIRVVRTESGRNWTEGQLAANSKAQDLGINTGKFWSAALDTRTRASHGELDGNRADEGGNFHSILGCVGPGPRLLAGVESAADNINCFTESMIPVSVNTKKIYKREYSGKIVRIKTSLGHYIESTVNHPILTDKGWISAGNLNKGQNIINVDTRKFIGFADKIKDSPPSFAEISSFDGITFPKHRVRSTVEQFHGDGSDGEIEIKSIDSCLPIENEAFLHALVEDKIFSFSDIHESLLSCNCPIDEFKVNSFLSPDGIMGGLSKVFSFLAGSVGHPEEHGLASISLCDSVGIKYSNYGSPIDAHAFRKLLDGFSGIILRDEIIGIDIVDFSGHVYNLQSESGLYGLYSSNGNMSIVHNCRCALDFRVEGISPQLRRIRGMDDPVPYTTFKDWAEPKGWTQAGGWPKAKGI